MTDGRRPGDLAAALGTALPPPPVEWHAQGGRQDAAVLVPVVPNAAGAMVLFTRRHADLPQHPGQVSFPGGRRDLDEDPSTCALREFEEELGLPRTRVQVVGGLPCHDSSTGFHVHPVVGIVHDLSGLRPHPDEVEEVLHVALAHLREPRRWEWREARRGSRRVMSPHFAVGGVWIWGLTARITLDLVARLP